MQFEDLRLREPLLRAVRTARYANPTPIQAQAIPPILAGRDVLGCAQTGTGKTAAFALPVLQLLSDRSTQATTPARHPRTLVLCPTRELAQQIYESFRTYGRHTDIRQAVVFGGVNQNPQVRAIRAGVDVLIATPGRLLDLMGQGLASVKGTEILILDEADRMLDMGFLPDLRRILTDVPRRRQTLLFAATMPTAIRKLADDILHDPVPIQVARVSSPAPSVDHWVCYVEKPGKLTLLKRLLADTPRTRTLVFTRTKHGADKVVRHLVRDGVNAAALHGNKSQGARTRALAAFKSAETPVLVATDLAARGLDVVDISHVINFDLTPDPETYVHRIGRTGRAGATGIAISFCTAEEHEDLRAIEQLLREPLQLSPDSPESAPPPRPSRPAPRAPGNRHRAGRQAGFASAGRQAGNAGQSGRSSRRGPRRRRSSAVASAS